MELVLLLPALPSRKLKLDEILKKAASMGLRYDLGFSLCLFISAEQSISGESPFFLGNRSGIPQAAGSCSLQCTWSLIPAPGSMKGKYKKREKHTEAAKCLLPHSPRRFGSPRTQSVAKYFNATECYILIKQSKYGPYVSESLIHNSSKYYSLKALWEKSEKPIDVFLTPLCEN